MNLLTKCLGYASYFIPSIPPGVYTYQALTFNHNASLPNVSQKIALEVQPFFKKMGLREDLVIHEAAADNYSAIYYSKGVDYFVQSKGTNYANYGGAVYVNPALCDFEREGCNLFIKHEAVHIKYQDNPMTHAVPFFYSVALASVTPTIVSRLPERVLPTFPRFIFGIANVIVQLVTQAIFTQSVERRADDLAIVEGTIEELKGGRRILLALQSCFSDAVLAELPLYHPTFASRIQKIEAALIERHAQIDESEEKIKISLLKEVLIPLIKKTGLKMELHKQLQTKENSISEVEDSLEVNMQENATMDASAHRTYGSQVQTTPRLPKPYRLMWV